MARSPTSELIAVDDLAEADLAAWRELAAAAEQPNPFFEPEWFMAAVRHLRIAADRLLVVRDGEGWRAVLPVERVGRGPLGVLGGSRHLYCFAGNPLVAKGADAAVIDALLSPPAGSSLGGGLFLHLVPDGPTARRLLDWAGERPRGAVPWGVGERAALRRRPECDYIDLSKKRRKEYRRMRRRLGEAAGEGGEVESRDRSADPQALERFLELEASGWKGERGTAMAAIPGHAEFLREACHGLREQGRLQLLTLEVDGRVLSAQVNLIAGPRLFTFKVAFDDEYSSRSPGTLLELDAVEHFHSDPRLQLVDSCAAPGAELVSRLWPDRLPIRSLLIGATGIGGRLAGAAVRARSRMRQSQQSPEDE